MQYADGKVGIGNRILPVFHCNQRQQLVNYLHGEQDRRDLSVGVSMREANHADNCYRKVQARQNLSAGRVRAIHPHQSTASIEEEQAPQRPCDHDVHNV